MRWQTRTEIYRPKKEIKFLCRICVRAANARSGWDDCATGGLAAARRGNRAAAWRAIDRRRSDDWFWENRFGLCVPPGGRPTGLPGTGERIDGWLPANGCHAHHAKGFQRVSWKIRGVQNIFSRAQLHRESIG